MTNFSILVASCFLFMFAVFLKNNHLCRSVYNWCDADDAFMSWRTENPTTYICQSDTGKELLRRLIDTYAVFLKNHSFIKNDVYLVFLKSLLDENPPDPPKPRKQPPKLQKPFVKERLFIFV